MELGEIITLITLIVGLIGAIAALIPTLIKLKDCLKDIIKNKDWKKILSFAMTAMKTVEATGKSGTEKKEMVIASVTDSCAEIGIELDQTTLENLIQYIDETIGFVNEMAKNKKTGKKKESK